MDLNFELLIAVCDAIRVWMEWTETVDVVRWSVDTPPSYACTSSIGVFVPFTHGDVFHQLNVASTRRMLTRPTSTDKLIMQHYIRGLLLTGCVYTYHKVCHTYCSYRTSARQLVGRSQVDLAHMGERYSSDSGDLQSTTPCSVPCFTHEELPIIK